MKTNCHNYDLTYLINYTDSHCNYRLIGVNVANFDKIHSIVFEIYVSKKLV